MLSPGVAQTLASRIIWEDPPDKAKLYPDMYQGKLAPWSDDGRKKYSKQETKMWSASVESAIEVEAVAKVRGPLAMIWSPGCD